MSGWSDLPLSSQGRREALLLAQQLAREGPFSRIYSSPLQRALLTARCIARACQVRLTLEPRLREIHCGDAEGLTYREVQQRYPESWARNLAQRDPDFRWPGGETYRTFRRRSLTALWDIARLHAGERVVVVTHAGVVSQVIGWLRGLSEARWEPFRPRNGSFSELVIREHRPLLLTFDQLPIASAATRESPSSRGRST